MVAWPVAPAVAAAGIAWSTWCPLFPEADAGLGSEEPNTGLCEQRTTGPLSTHLQAPGFLCARQTGPSGIPLVSGAPDHCRGVTSGLPEAA